MRRQRAPPRHAAGWCAPLPQPVQHDDHLRGPLRLTAPTAAYAELSFERVKAEVPWIQMWHMGAPVPRLVHIQGDREIPSAGAAAGSGGGCTYTPLYRHPTDLSPAVEAWTPAVRAIAQLVSKKLGRTYNQALVQLYRSGKDAISEHADKTLDIEHGAPIVGVSLGASRTFTLRSKARLKANTGPQSIQRIALPNNSVYVRMRGTTQWLSSTTLGSCWRMPVPRNLPPRVLMNVTVSEKEGAGGATGRMINFHWQQSTYRRLGTRPH